jgi:NAD(P)-dependent dehydrogenase (short-subunit alcohol dehydrogenase family)
LRWIQVSTSTKLPLADKQTEVFMDLEKKRVVILGGSSGIGLATAKLAGQAGADLVIASSRKASVNRALEVLPAGTQGHAVDLSNEARVRELFEVLGAFDHLVYTAGENLSLGALEQTSIGEARRFWTLRYWGALAAVKYGRPNIRNEAPSCSPQGSRAAVRIQGGLWRLRSVAPWKASRVRSLWNSLLSESTSSAPA